MPWDAQIQGKTYVWDLKLVRVPGAQPAPTEPRCHPVGK